MACLAKSKVRQSCRPEIGRAAGVHSALSAAVITHVGRCTEPLRSAEAAKAMSVAWSLEPRMLLGSVAAHLLASASAQKPKVFWNAASGTCMFANWFC
jgi:hypothetical protein